MRRRRPPAAGDGHDTDPADTVLADGPHHLVTRHHEVGAAPVVLKATRPGAPWGHRAALWREARLLDRLRGPGVVELLDVVERRRSTVLVLAFAPGGDLGHRRAPDPGRLRAGLSAVVGRLRAAGVAHAALRPEHVALTAWGDPVLVGFGSARTGRGADLDADRAALDQLLDPP